MFNESPPTTFGGPQKIRIFNNTGYIIINNNSNFVRKCSNYDTFSISCWYNMDFFL